MTQLLESPPIGALDECPWLARFAPRHRLRDERDFATRAFDCVVAALVLLMTLPVLALAAVAIKATSPGGPLLFKQQRTGYLGREFTLFKLRTMVPDAEARKSALAHLNSREWPDFKIARDPRVTRVGRLLRVTSIDELPQLFNVLRGDMALVGPRPTTLRPEGYALWQSERFGVRPGVTGLWQIAARDSSSFEHRLRLDIAYATRRSFRLDIAILWRTVPAVIKRRGAG
jgi:lipopolysaccharide/colanic/teichoic acid biosynthesis glycosyltransferase